MTDAVRTWMLLQRLRSNVRRAPESLARLQDELLRAAVSHAYHTVPFYRRVWDQPGFDARRVKGFEDIGRMPIITSAMVKEAAQHGELLARGVDTRRCTFLDSSGSSGHPLRIWKQPLEERLRRAVGLRLWFEHGFRWRQMTAQFQIRTGPSHPLQQFGVSRKAWISTQQPIEEQLTRFLRSKADVVVGTATALRRVARAIESARVKPTQPRIVFCAGELLDAETRGLVKRALGVDPIGVYGQTEVGYIAWHCEQRQGLHVNADTHLVEVLRGGKPACPGELGAIVVTDLRARTMPLLRYDTGDLAVASAERCPCGRQLPLLRSIEGRARGAVRLADGRVQTTRAIVDHLAGWLRLGEYRLYQETIQAFRLEVTGYAADRHSPDATRRRLRAILGEIDLTISPISSWPYDGTGKTHTVFSALTATEPVFQ
ncbi:MAG: phenylacetate--CoA ligase family protein [Nitrospiraceae bacterium]